MLSRNAKVYMACRNATSAMAAISELKKDTGKEAIYLHLDMSSLVSVGRAAKELLSIETEIHALVNNAWVHHQSFGIDALC